MLEIIGPYRCALSYNSKTGTANSLKFLGTANVTKNQHVSGGQKKKESKSDPTKKKTIGQDLPVKGERAKKSKEHNTSDSQVVSYPSTKKA
jgi:hypothetical protein